jgi:hypothetical protein
MKGQKNALVGAHFPNANADFRFLAKIVELGTKVFGGQIEQSLCAIVLEVIRGISLLGDTCVI